MAAGQDLTAIEGYIKEKEIDSIFKAILVKCFRERPESPAEFVMSYLVEAYPAEAARILGRMGAGRRGSVTGGVAYLNDELGLGSLYELLADRMLADRPSDPMQHVIDTVIFVKESMSKEAGANGEEEEEEEPMETEETEEVGEMVHVEPTINMARVRRPSVSAECVTVHQDISTTPERKVYPKTDDAKAFIKDVVKDNILFKGLDDRLFADLVDAMFEVKCASGATIIRQGDEADNIYMIHTGECDVYIARKNAAPQQVGTPMQPGQCFGELALMYNSARTATVKARSDVTLFALDRVTFRKILSDTTNVKRKLHEQFLEKVPLFKSLTAAERSRIADELTLQSFKAGDDIIRQGDVGDDFFILEEGSAVAKIFMPDGKGTNEVRQYEAGDYFGELALINNKPRGATVQATSATVRVVSMNRGSFNRLMGSTIELMKRSATDYKVLDTF